MIRVERCAAPEVLARNKNIWDEALRTARSPRQRKQALYRYGHRQIKSALRVVFHDKCAYCESHISHVEYGHIEHFRPKSKQEFEHLAFEWDNLFLACSICNGVEYKSDRFPSPKEGGPPINPCDDSPEDHLSFFFDQVAKVATVVHKTERGKTTIDLVGLNRPELRAYRSRQVEKLAALARFVATDERARQILDEARSGDHEYAAFARALLPRE
ncbi:MAG: retron system putative HNH endonuclease [Terracidiphilus sp.]